MIVIFNSMVLYELFLRVKCLLVTSSLSLFLLHTIILAFAQLVDRN